MRKSVKIIIAIFSVMICLLVILSMTLSGTFAKYVTSGGDFSDSARVAKWGVTIDTYSDLVSSYTKDNVIVFQASGGTQDNIIAPGTSGSLIGFEVKGEAEVSFAVDIVDESVNFSFGEGYNASSKLLVDEDNEEFEYFPIIIKFTKYDKKKPNEPTVVTYGMRGMNVDNPCDTVTELENEVKNALKIALDEDIAPGEDVHRMYSVEWEWAYSADANNSYQTREKDTILGEALVNNKDSFNIAVAADIVAAQTR